MLEFGNGKIQLLVAGCNIITESLLRFTKRVLEISELQAFSVNRADRAFYVYRAQVDKASIRTAFAVSSSSFLIIRLYVKMLSLFSTIC